MIAACSCGQYSAALVNIVCRSLLKMRAHTRAPQGYLSLSVLSNLGIYFQALPEEQEVVV